MKRVGSIILLLFYTVLGYWIPEFAEIDSFLATFLNLSAMAGAISLISEAVKSLIGYDSEEGWEYTPYFTVGFVSIGLGIFAYYVNIPGIYEVAESLWEVIVISVVTGGLAKSFYDTDFGYMLIKIATGHQLNPEPNKKK